MKRILLLLAFTLANYAAYPQTWVRFQNDSSSLVYTNMLAYGGERGLMSGAGQFHFGLFLAPAGTYDPNLFVFTGLYATNTAIPGRYSGGIGVVPMWNTGQEMALQVRGWSVSLGNTWPEVDMYLHGGLLPPFSAYGESPIIRVPNAGSEPPLPPLWPNFPGFDLYVVPEPSAVALMSLSLLGCVVRRRFVSTV